MKKIPQSRVVSVVEGFLGLNEGLRLIKTHSSEHKSDREAFHRQAKVYKDHDYNEYRVKHFEGGRYQPEADYHTNDLEDAHATAQHFVKGAVSEASVAVPMNFSISRNKLAIHMATDKGLKNTGSPAVRPHKTFSGAANAEYQGRRTRDEYGSDAEHFRRKANMTPAEQASAWEKAHLSFKRNEGADDIIKAFLDEGRDSHPAGMRVRVGDGSGVHSGKAGTIQPWSSVPVDGRGVPQLAGEYRSMSDSKRRRDERPVKLDNGETITMFKNRLHPEA